jgi:chromosome segregation ATPase
MISRQYQMMTRANIDEEKIDMMEFRYQTLKWWCEIQTKKINDLENNIKRLEENILNAASLSNNLYKKLSEQIERIEAVRKMESYLEKSIKSKQRCGCLRGLNGICMCSLGSTETEAEDMYKRFKG